MLLQRGQLIVKHLRGIKKLLVTESPLLITQTENYARWGARQVKKIVNEDELFEVENYAHPTPPTVKEAKKKPIPKQVNQKTPTADNVCFDEEITFSEETSIKNQDEPARKLKISTKLEANEKLMKTIMMTVKLKNKRKKQNQILLEGHRYIKDAIDAGLKAETIIFSQWEDINNLPLSDKKTQILKVPYRTIQLWSSLTTAPGMMGVFKKPEPLQISRKNSLPITIICDQVRDPGNMGSILRAAAGVGCEKVLLTKGCVDFWDSKVVRSAAGAHFRVPIYGSQEWEDIRSLIHSDAHVYVADSNKETFSNEDFDKVLLHEIEETSNSDNDLEDVQSNDESKKSEKPKRTYRKKMNPLLKMTQIPVIPYYSVDYTQNQIILIVGGETEGLSQESYDLINSRKGVRVNIPLDNNVDSLNAGMALGIVAFEVKRQLLLVREKLKALE
ncbi:rRNA methyltransferase 3, mitochondrial [Trichogramma pretiosum]|uniref:rRNA methyltransferase 3, mitochondrial n=1 Tax=Trichogramma pretiosum TaxID=7493 RepID=UPI0006C9D89E|nr:rRNA methyltransferase 3, mitochondrial [Trichogramma pretiosum]